MKARNGLRLLPLQFVAISLSAIITQGTATAATNQYWNPGGSGGDGNWGTSPGDKNWNTVAGAPAGNTFWPDTINDRAVFQDATGGTVTVSDPVQTNGILQTGANYSINAGTITLVRDAALNTPSIGVQSGTLAIDSILAGSSGMIKSGAGNLALSGSNTYTGTTSLTGGTLTLTGSLASASIAISSGASLVDQSGGIGASTVLDNSGTLTTNVAETLSTYTQNGSGILSGPGLLTASGGATLNGGTVSGNLSGNITSTGTVLVSGTIGGGSLAVTNGTLTLTGTSTNTPVDISAPASLVDSNGGLASNAIVTNAGTLTINAADSVSTYTQNGSGILSGSALLTASGGATLNGGTVSGNLSANITSTGTVLVSGTIGGGSLAVTNGVLTLTGSSTNTPVDISAPASLVDSNGGLASNAIVTNAGTLTVNADDTVSTYTQNGSGILGGTGLLTASGGATLNGGTISGNLSANITSTGTVLVSGTIGGGSLAVTNGVLTLTGSSTNTPVDISAPASLVDSNGGLASNAIVTNAGTLTVNAADTVSTYTQNGSGILGGTGVLTASGGATLNGGTISGNLSANITSTGTLLVSGTIGGGSLAVTNGILTLTGTSTNSPIDIFAPASLVDSNGGLASNAIVTNAGTLTVNAADTVFTYTQNGSGILGGSGILTATGGATLNGGSITGNLRGDTTSKGIVLVSGTIGGGSLSVAGGALTLTGTSTNTSVSISPSALLVDSNGGLASNAIVTNAGTLIVNADDAVGTYISNGTLASGTGTLSTFTSNLNNGSLIAGLLSANTITTNGAVTVTGSATANTIHIASGVLTNSGLLGTPSTHLDIASGATLIAGGTQRYGLLTTSGPGAGVWQGDLINPATVSPGGATGTGILKVIGDFTQSSAGILKMDVGGTGHDFLDIDGTATFDGTLDLARLGSSIAPFVPVQIVSASDYEGNFATLEENLDGAVWFNPENGTVTRIPSAAESDQFLGGANKNQASTWMSLYDDVIDPGTNNIFRIPGHPGQYDFSSGIADLENPDLLWALAASFTPSGLLNTELLNRLSPEVYTSLGDYATQATRSHQRTALNAPPLAKSHKTDAKNEIANDSKSSAKEAISPTPLRLDWEFFAAADYFDVETDNSRNLADYELSGAGLMAGARTHVTNRVQLAAYLTGDDGSIDGPLINSDGSGWSIGLIGEAMLYEKYSTRLTAAISYGRYSFSGTRESVSANSEGWSPGRVHFSDVDSDSLEMFAGLEATVYQTEKVRVIPSAGLRYATGTTDGFTESTPTADGSPIALDVDRNRFNSLLAEIGVTAETKVTDRLTLQGELGFNLGIGEDSHDLSASFVKGSRPMHVSAEGLSDDLMFIGLGATYSINESIRIGVGYRAEVRSAADTLEGVNVSSSFRF